MEIEPTDHQFEDLQYNQEQQYTYTQFDLKPNETLQDVQNALQLDQMVISTNQSVQIQKMWLFSCTKQMIKNITQQKDIKFILLGNRQDSQNELQILKKILNIIKISD
ncbi:hypothetical protein PPERSA_04900 [Pseudocohnilembus persalinus]|uniref:Uncharacterized protein n=1 Tax=Pseudocohnilembus persalinus TaxID=266149 RepID=A0A0V0QJC6_PSEPJ|nr:hypothetical protein PPERSA_04900 [Pseudocohnilembus persalinus]|eukprot:KRX02278.1 hypothetical protein PPERSA_04900 [Pseudocohnilembus persalinus]